MSLSDFEKVARRLDSMRELVVKLETDLTAIPAISPRSGGTGESRKAAYVEEFLSSAGVERSSTWTQRTPMRREERDPT